MDGAALSSNTDLGILDSGIPVAACSHLWHEHFVGVGSLGEMPTRAGSPWPRVCEWVKPGGSRSPSDELGSGRWCVTHPPPGVVRCPSPARDSSSKLMKCQTLEHGPHPTVKLLLSQHQGRWSWAKGDGA